MKKISIVIPAHNEAENVKVVAGKIAEQFAGINYAYELIFVDDGSRDNTLQCLQELSATNPQIFYIELSRNFGHQNALKAGLDYASGDAVISMDADLQHPPEVIPLLLKKWVEGYDIVYTRRMEDKTLSRRKRMTSKWFYRLTNKLSDIKLEEGTADFRLMDRTAVDAFCSFTENDLFIRGLVKWLGFKQYALDYDPAKRYAGETKYTFKKMLNLALRGITSFSTRPLYFAIYLGFFISLLSLLYLPYVIYSYVTGHYSAGWGSIILTITFFGGLQLLILGIIGIYLGKLFMQAKHRPNYIVRATNL